MELEDVPSQPQIMPPQKWRAGRVTRKEEEENRQLASHGILPHGRRDRCGQGPCTGHVVCPRVEQNDSVDI